MSPDVMERETRKAAPDRPAPARGRRGPVRLLRTVAVGIARLWLFALLVGLWEVASRAAADQFFPPPSEIVVALYDLWFSGPVSRFFLTEDAVDDFAPSMTNLFTGWALASLGGVAIGLVLGRFRRACEVVEPILQFGRAVPPPTLIPFLLAVLSLGPTMRITTIVFGVIWPVLLNTIDGVRSVDRLQLDTARVFGITGLQRLRRIILPSAAPKIFAGLRVSLGFALILMVISELVGGTEGIGAQLVFSQQSFEMAEMWAGVVFLGILGMLFNLVFMLVERRVLAWHVGVRRQGS